MERKSSGWIHGLGVTMTGGLLAALPFGVQAQQVTAPAEPLDAAQAEPSPGEVQSMRQQLEQIKASYAQEIRRLRELDMQMQALQAKVNGKLPPASTVDPSAIARNEPLPAAATRTDQIAPSRPADGNYAGTAEDAAKAREAVRSVADVKQQNQALFNQRLTIENSISYNRYDRKQFTLNGFLALDAIFLGNIAIENVESDTLTYNMAARWGVSPRLTLNLDVPYLGRKTVYQKGGAGGSAAAIAQEETTGTGLGDVALSANYKLFGEHGRWPETVLTAGITAPTGREPYGIPWKVLERDDDQFIRFAVPEEQPTGNGVWQATVGLSAVKTADPAILFANLGATYSFNRDFDDIDSNPDTTNPGSVKLGNSYYFGAGVAFAFNERTSLSMSLTERFSARAKTRYDGTPWVKVIGSDANAAAFNLGVTYALNQKTTLVTLLGIGLTPDAPDFSLAIKVPYTL